MIELKKPIVYGVTVHLKKYIFMSKLIGRKTIVLCLMIIVSFGFTYINKTVELRDMMHPDNLVVGNLEAKVPTANEIVFTSEKPIPFLRNEFNGFKEALAFKESQGNYFSINTYGYMGKYQFGTGTLHLIGIYNPNNFLKNPALQEKAFIAYTSRNKWVLRKDISRFVGKRFNGITVTESGILAAAHLAGPGRVKRYLRTGGSFKFADAYGTTIKDYMKKFSGYDLSSIPANKKAKA